ncbi:unnamed protein product, partial [Prorocentrum cordatum]
AMLPATARGEAVPCEGGDAPNGQVAAGDQGRRPLQRAWQCRPRWRCGRPRLGAGVGGRRAAAGAAAAPGGWRGAQRGAGRARARLCM